MGIGHPEAEVHVEGNASRQPGQLQALGFERLVGLGAQEILAGLVLQCLPAERQGQRHEDKQAYDKAGQHLEAGSDRMPAPGGLFPACGLAGFAAGLPSRCVLGRCIRGRCFRGRCVL